MSIHHVLPETISDDNLMETMCGLCVKVSRFEDGIKGFKTVPADRPIQCVFDERDVNCKPCKRIWLEVKPR